MNTTEGGLYGSQNDHKRRKTKETGYYPESTLTFSIDQWFQSKGVVQFDEHVALTSLSELIDTADTDTISPEAYAEHALLRRDRVREKLIAIMQFLDSRERSLLNLLYGLDDRSAEQDVARLLGLKLSKVRQARLGAEPVALEKLARKLERSVEELEAEIDLALRKLKPFAACAGLEGR